LHGEIEANQLTAYVFAGFRFVQLFISEIFLAKKNQYTRISKNRRTEHYRLWFLLCLVDARVDVLFCWISGWGMQLSGKKRG
jgi:hypothetical protein